MRSAAAASRGAVRHVHDAEAVVVREVAEEVDEQRAAGRVDHRGRLVGDEELRRAGERGRDREPLQLAARQRRRLPVDERGAGRRASSSASTSTRCRVRHAPHHVVAHAHAEHLGLGSLEDDRRPADAARARPRPGRSISPPSGRRRPASSRGERRLARAVARRRSRAARPARTSSVTPASASVVRVRVAEARRRGARPGAERASDDAVARQLVTPASSTTGGAERAAHAPQRRGRRVRARARSPNTRSRRA